MILITGGAGFIGSNLQAALSDRGLETIVVDWLGDTGKWRNLGKHPPSRIVPPEQLDDLLASNLPREKTLATLDVERLTAPMRRQLPTLCQGGFAERAENVLIFGLPGRGKTHVAIAIGLELIQAGMPVLFIEVFKLVQRLLVAKRDLKLERELQKLDAFDVLIIDDIGYIQQDREEMEVLFTLLAERYERKSVMITSNLVFSQWDRIFKDPLTTQGAIDRVVHHAVILELVGTSYRAEVAGARTEPDAE